MSPEPPESDDHVDLHVDLHTALVRHRLGRWVVAGAVAVLASWITLPNLPAGPARSQLDSWWAPATELGLVQDWAVFSPNPRSQSLDVRADVELASGEVLVWDVPEFDPVLGAYRQYRWKKWQERVRLDARADLWGPTVEWLRREYDDAVRITLVRRWIDHGALTANGWVDEPDAGWNEFRFCTWPADPDGRVPTCG